MAYNILCLSIYMVPSLLVYDNKQMRYRQLCRYTPIIFFRNFSYLFFKFSLIFTNMHIRFVYQNTVLKYYGSTFIW